MLRFCNLCYKVFDASFVNLQKCNRKFASNVRHKKRKEKEIEEEKQKGRPIITTRRKEMNFYEGQVYPKHVPVPLVSRGWHHAKSKGDHFFVHLVEEPEEKPVDASFDAYNFHPEISSNLKEMGITKPLDIQMQGIPKILSGRNTVIAAETGCGKTLAYLLPMVNQILAWKKIKERPYNSPLGLIVTPSHELAVQIGIQTTKLCKRLGIKAKILIGGRTKKIMLNPPVGDIDVVIASFGVISKLTTTRIYKLDFVRHVVLDEADALFDETFEAKLKVFMSRIPIGFVQTTDECGFPKLAQLTLASATMPRRTTEVLGHVINVDSLEYISGENLHRILVTQKFMRLGKTQKPQALLQYVKPKVARKEQVVVFSNDNKTCDWISMFLNECGIPTVSLNGSTPVVHRRKKYAEFVSGRCLVLSATNLGSRGLDTKIVRHVLNYEFPLDTSDYIHRCGRTGRVGNRPEDCRVTNFISTLPEIGMVMKIETAIRKGKPIPIFNYHQQFEDPPLEEEPSHVENNVENIEDLEDSNTIPY